MLLFGHVGPTSGAVRLSEKLLNASSGKSAEQKIDYRLVIIGSMLPDIIDKSIWLLTSSAFQWSGRGYAHTFIFNLLLLIIGLFFLKSKNKYGLLTVAIGSFFHLAFDLIWRQPEILWWPLVGNIQRAPLEGWVGGMWYALFHSPYIMVSESLGLLTAAYFGIRLLLRKRIIHFIKTGDIS